MRPTKPILRLLAVTAILAILMAAFPASVIQADEDEDTCATSIDDSGAALEIASVPDQIDASDTVIFAQASGVISGFDVKGTCNAKNVEFFANKLERTVILFMKVTNLGDCEVVITGSWGEIHVQRTGLVDASSSIAWIASMSAGESARYSCSGTETRACAF